MSDAHPTCCTRRGRIWWAPVEAAKTRALREHAALNRSPRQHRFSRLLCALGLTA